MTPEEIKETNKVIRYLLDALEKVNAKDIQYIFNGIENSSKDITGWIDFLGLSRNETYSIQIAHKIRNKIMSGLNYHFGVKHLDNQKFPGIAEMDFKSASDLIDLMLVIKYELNFITPIINKILYPKD